MAIPAAREPGPLVILLRFRTVAKVDSIGFVVSMNPVLAGKSLNASSCSTSSLILATAFGNFASLVT